MSTIEYIQWGLENPASHGTPVAADTILLGEHPKIPDDRKPTFIEDAIPSRSQGLRTRVDTILVRDTIRFPHSYWGILPILLSMGLKGNVTPAEQNGGEGDYLWTFTPSDTATNNIDSGTLELGDAVQAYEIEYMMIERIRISGTIDQAGGASPVLIEADYFGRQVKPSTISGGLSYPTAAQRIPLNAKLSQLFIDTTWAGVGTSEITGLRRFMLDLYTGVHPDSQGAAAAKTFTEHLEGMQSAILTATFKRAAATDTIFDTFKAGDTLQVGRLKINGPQIASGYNCSLNIDLGGELEMVNPMAEDDRGTGLDTVVLRTRYDPTGAKILQCTTTVPVSAI